MNKKAFTLVELLIIISIIGLLIALLIPAIQSARESSRRLKCSNNLKQFGLAIHNYESTNRRFPPGNSGSLWSNGISVHAKLLEYLEESYLNNKIDFTVPYNHINNNEARMQLISIFLCPSDSFSFNNLDKNLGAPNNYYANAGTNIMAGSPTNDRSDPNFNLPSPNGIFFRDSKIKVGNITDGLTHTAAFCEKITGDGNNNTVTEKSDTFRPGTFPSSPDEAMNNCSSFDINDLSKQGVSNVGAPWIWAYHSTTIYYHISSPNTRSCMYPPGRIMTTANSQHKNGVNIVLCDSSVHFINENIDLSIWRAYGTRDGGETNYEIK